MRRDGLPYWAEPASAAAERKREKEHLLSSGNVMPSSLQAGLNWRVAENPQQNVLNTPPYWQLQKSKDLHPLNCPDPSCTENLTIRDTGRRGLLDRPVVHLETQQRSD